MEIPFEKKPLHETLTVQVAETFYRGDEIVAYFNDLLDSLMDQENSVKNRLQLYNMARILIKKRENEKASTVIYRALSRYKRDSSFLKLKAELFINKKDYASAVEVINMALSDSVNDMSFMILKARIFSLSGNIRGEENVYLEMLSNPINDYFIDRGKLIALRNLADLYFRNKRYPEAEKAAFKALSKVPDEATWALYFSILAKMGKKDELNKSRDKFARFKRARVYFDKGSEFEALNKFNLALTNYKSGLEIFPDDPLVNEKIGTILMYRKKWYSKAELFLRKAVELDPEQAGYRSNLVICLKQQEKYEEAFKEAKIAEVMDPTSNILFLRQLSSKLNKQEEFIEIVKKVIEVDSKGTLYTLRYELALMYEHLNYQKQAEYWYNKALTLLVKKINHFPDDWEAYVDLGLCCFKLKKYPEAESAYLTAEGMRDADVVEIYEHLVSLYQETNQPSKSTPYLQRLIKMQPGKMLNYLDLGINYLTRLQFSLKRKD